MEATYSIIICKKPGWIMTGGEKLILGIFSSKLWELLSISELQSSSHLSNPIICYCEKLRWTLSLLQSLTYLMPPSFQDLNGPWTRFECKWEPSAMWTMPGVHGKAYIWVFDDEWSNSQYTSQFNSIHRNSLRLLRTRQYRSENESFWKPRLLHAMQ